MYSIISLMCIYLYNIYVLTMLFIWFRNLFFFIHCEQSLATQARTQHEIKVHEGQENKWDNEGLVV